MSSITSLSISNINSITQNNVSQNLNLPKLTTEQLERLSAVLAKKHYLLPKAEGFLPLCLTADDLINFFKLKSTEQGNWIEKILLIGGGVNHTLMGLEFADVDLEIIVNHKELNFNVFKSLIETFIYELFKKSLTENPEQKNQIPEHLSLELHKKNSEKLRKYLSKIYSFESTIFYSGEGALYGIGQVQIKILNRKLEKQNYFDFKFQFDLITMSLIYEGSTDEFYRDLQLLIERKSVFHNFHYIDHLFTRCVLRVTQCFEIQDLTAVCLQGKNQLLGSNPTYFQKFIKAIRDDHYHGNPHGQALAFLNALNLLDCDPNFVEQFRNFKDRNLPFIEPLLEFITLDAKNILKLIQGVFLYEWLSKNPSTPNGYFFSFSKENRPYIQYNTQEFTQSLRVKNPAEVAVDFLEAYRLFEEKLNGDQWNILGNFFKLFNLAPFECSESYKNKVISTFIQYEPIEKNEFLIQTINKNNPELTFHLNTILVNRLHQKTSLINSKCSEVVNEVTRLHSRLPDPETLLRFLDLVETHIASICEDSHLKRCIENCIYTWYRKLSENVSITRLDAYAKLLRHKGLSLLDLSKAKLTLIADYHDLASSEKVFPLLAAAKFISEAKQWHSTSLELENKLSALKNYVPEALDRILPTVKEANLALSALEILLTTNIPRNSILKHTIYLIQNGVPKEEPSFAIKVANYAQKFIKLHSITFEEFSLFKNLREKLRVSSDPVHGLGFLKNVADSSSDKRLQKEIQKVLISKMGKSIFSSDLKSFRLALDCFLTLQNVETAAEEFAKISDLENANFSQLGTILIKASLKIDPQLAFSSFKLFDSKLNPAQKFEIAFEMIKNYAKEIDFGIVWQNFLIPNTTQENIQQLIELGIEILERPDFKNLERVELNLVEQLKKHPTHVSDHLLNRLLEICLKNLSSVNFESLLMLTTVLTLNEDTYKFVSKFLKNAFEKEYDLINLKCLTDKLITDDHNHYSSMLLSQILDHLLEKENYSSFINSWKQIKNKEIEAYRTIQRKMCQSTFFKILENCVPFFQSGHCENDLLYLWINSCKKIQDYHSLLKVPSFVLESLRNNPTSKIIHTLKNIEDIFHKFSKKDQKSLLGIMRNLWTVISKNQEVDDEVVFSFLKITLELNDIESLTTLVEQNEKNTFLLLKILNRTKLTSEYSISSLVNLLKERIVDLDLENVEVTKEFFEFLNSAISLCKETHQFVAELLVLFLGNRNKFAADEKAHLSKIAEKMLHAMEGILAVNMVQLLEQHLDIDGNAIRKEKANECFINARHQLPIILKHTDEQFKKIKAETLLEVLVQVAKFSSNIKNKQEAGLFIYKLITAFQDLNIPNSSPVMIYLLIYAKKLRLGVTATTFSKDPHFALELEAYTIALKKLEGLPDTSKKNKLASTTLLYLLKEFPRINAFNMEQFNKLRDIFEKWHIYFIVDCLKNRSFGFLKDFHGTVFQLLHFMPDERSRALLLNNIFMQSTIPITTIKYILVQADSKKITPLEYLQTENLGNFPFKDGLDAVKYIAKSNWKNEDFAQFDEGEAGIFDLICKYIVELSQEFAGSEYALITNKIKIQHSNSNVYEIFFSTFHIIYTIIRTYYSFSILTTKNYLDIVYETIDLMVKKSCHDFPQHEKFVEQAYENFKNGLREQSARLYLKRVK